MKTIFPSVDQTKASTHLNNHHVYDIPDDKDDDDDDNEDEKGQCQG